MADIDFTMKQKTGSGYDNLYPTPAKHASSHLPDGEDPISIEASNLVNGSVTTAKIANGAVTGAKLADGSVTNSYTAVLLASNWSTSTVDYTQQTITVSGLLNTDNYLLDANIGQVSGQLAKQAMDDAFGLIYDTFCSTNGQLSVVAREIPSVDIYLKITVFRK